MITTRWYVPHVRILAMAVQVHHLLNAFHVQCHPSELYSLTSHVLAILVTLMTEPVPYARLVRVHAYLARLFRYVQRVILWQVSSGL